MAQFRRDLEEGRIHPDSALKSTLQLTSPSFGKWYGFSRDIMKLYRERRNRFFDRTRWRSDVNLQSGVVVLLEPESGAYLILSPFVLFTDHLKGVPDVFLLNNVAKNRAIYASAQFQETLDTGQWEDGAAHREALAGFFDRLRMADPLSDDVELDLDAAPSVEDVDQGTIPSPEHLDASLYGIFLVHQQKALAAGAPTDPHGRDRILLEAGLRVIDAAMFIMEDAGIRDLSRIFAHRPGWFTEERRWIAADFSRYREDLTHPHCRTFTAGVNRADGRERTTVPALWLKRPRSDFFKHWVRTDRRAPEGKGYPLMVVDWSDEKKNRFVVSVDPESGFDLKGLGERLEEREVEKRAALDPPRPRPREPRRWPADNADPWYFGQDHDHTIIDAPFRGTVLTAEEVLEIIQAWQAPPAVVPHHHFNPQPRTTRGRCNPLASAVRPDHGVSHSVSDADHRAGHFSGDRRGPLAQDPERKLGLDQNPGQKGRSQGSPLRRNPAISVGANLVFAPKWPKR